MIDLGQSTKLITRSEWKARSPRSRSSVNPTFGTTAHWEGPHMGWPWDHAACFSLVRGIQNFHMDTRGWQDGAYTGIVCPHGYVFEMRWIGHRTAANGTNDGNNRALALCYLGGQGDKFTDDGKRAMRAAMDYLDGRGAGPGRNGHRDWKPTECPGEDIYVWVHAGQKVPGGTTQPQEDDFMALFDSKEEFIKASEEGAQRALKGAFSGPNTPVASALSGLFEDWMKDVLRGAVSGPNTPVARGLRDVIRKSQDGQFADVEEALEALVSAVDAG